MKEVSKCCKASVHVEPKNKINQRGHTLYNVCTKCGKHCDVEVEDE